MTQANLNVENMQNMQRINTQNMEETLRIQRQEGQYAQHMQPDLNGIALRQLDQQENIAVAAAGAMGQMGQAPGMPGAPGAPPPVPGAAPPPLPGAPPVPPAGVLFNVAVNGQTAGPFDINALAQMAQAGQFNAQSMVWKQGMAAWAAAGTVPELAGLFAPAPRSAAGSGSIRSYHRQQQFLFHRQAD
jgi:hypothetical protein